MEKGKIPEENQVSNTSSSETQTDRKKDALMMPEGKNIHKQNRKIKWLSSNVCVRLAPWRREILSAVTLKRLAAFSLASSSDLPLTQ